MMGRPKKLSAAQAARIFAAQCQISDCEALISRILAEAGISPGSAQHHLRNVWRSNGSHEQLLKRLGWAPRRPTAAKRSRSAVQGGAL